MLGIVIERIRRAQVTKIELALLIEGHELEANSMTFLEYPARRPNLDLERINPARLEWLDPRMSVVGAQGR